MAASFKESGSFSGQTDNRFNMNRKNTSMPQPKVKKPGFFPDDDEPEASMYNFNIGAQNVFRPDKEMMTSASPSQLTGPFSSNLYAPPQPSGTIGNIALPPRSISSAPFQRNSTGHVTPTSIGPSYPIGLPQQQASPNRNLFSMSQRGISNLMPTSQAPISQIKRPNPISSGLMSSHTNTITSITTGISSFGRTPGESNQPGLDLSEFPTLGNRSAPSNPVPAARNYGEFPPVSLKTCPGSSYPVSRSPMISDSAQVWGNLGMVSKPAQETTQEFQIQQEDFPALPGAATPLFADPPTSSATENARKTLFGAVLQPSGSPGISSYEQAVSKDGAKFPGDKSSGNQQRRGIHTHPDGTVSNIPTGMVTDQFGMVGLLTFIRAADTDLNLVALAPGIDLTTLGLNLNSPENLYSTFQSPWADSPCRPQDIVLSDFHVPSEYLTNIFIRDKLAPIKLNRYTEDLLFFLFYMNGGDVLQLAAAAELYNRDWRYHKDERVWITRVPGMEPMMKTTSYERGTYYFFDAQNWRKVAKEFRLEYDKLEERPHLPSTLHHNPNQPQGIAH